MGTGGGGYGEMQMTFFNSLSSAVQFYLCSAAVPVFAELARAVTAKQVGAIVHGGGINHEAFEFDAECAGLHCMRLDGHTRLYQAAA